MKRKRICKWCGAEEPMHYKSCKWLNQNLVKDKTMTQATRATLYLGAKVGSNPGYIITSSDFARFLEEFVTPHFPGFTVRDTVGYWKGNPEFSRELVILAEDGTSPFFHDKVELIADAYKTKFQQEAVMISYEPVSILWDVPTKAEPEKVPYHLAHQFDVV